MDLRVNRGGWLADVMSEDGEGDDCTGESEAVVADVGKSCDCDD